MVTTKVQFSTLKSIFFFGLIIALTVALLYIVSPFLYPIFWAAVLAVMFAPLHNRLAAHLKHRGLSAFLILLFVILLILIPLAIIGVLLVNESIELYTSVSQTGIFTGVDGNVEGVSALLKHTSLAPLVDTITNQWTIYASEITKNLSGALFNSIKNITQNSVRFLFMLFIMSYTLYFFLKDGPRILNKLRHLSPLGDTYESMLYQRFTSTTRAALKSTFIMGGAQGLIGGLLFWITGIQGALLWSVIMAALSILPGVGAFLVWAPAGIIMLALGHVWQGVTILVGGLLIVSTIDNLLRPPLMGKETQMHPLVVFFSTLGGLVIFGVSGFVIGPVVAAFYLSIITIYDQYYKNELQKN